MKPLTLDLDRELEALDPQTALKFKQAVLSMLRLVKARPRADVPFHQRIARHPAIGTWPAEVDADRHIAQLREEWDR